MTDPTELPSGQEMIGIEYDNPAYTIVFIVVQWNSMDFSFVNRVENRFTFKRERWAKWLNLLRPLSCHAFLCRSYNTKSGSGQGFTPEEHIMEFNGLDEARVFNKFYLEQYRRWNDSASADFATDETFKFVQKMIDFDDKRRKFTDEYIKAAKEEFEDEEFLAAVAWAYKVAALPPTDIKIDGDDALWLLHGDVFE